MKYDITKQSAPAMPTLGKGTECVRLLLSQISKDMHEPLVPMLFPILGAHISGSEFQYRTSVGRNHVAKWPTSWPNRWAIRVNCQLLSRPSVVTTE